MARLADELWRVNQPQPHRFVVHRGSAAEIAKAEGRILDDFSSFQGWKETGWTNCKAKAEAKDGVLTVVAPRQKGVRDMLGYSKRLEADLTKASTLMIRMKADKGAPFGVEWGIDGKLVRLGSYVPAKGEWETLAISVTGKRASGLTLILAEGGANAEWATEAATYQFDGIWLE